MGFTCPQIFGFGDGTIGLDRGEHSFYYDKAKHLKEKEINIFSEAEFTVANCKHWSQKLLLIGDKAQPQSTRVIC